MTTAHLQPVPGAYPPPSHSHRRFWVIMGVIAVLFALTDIGVYLIATSQPGHNAADTLPPKPSASISASAQSASADPTAADTTAPARPAPTTAHPAQPRTTQPPAPPATQAVAMPVAHGPVHINLGRACGEQAGVSQWVYRPGDNAAQTIRCVTGDTTVIEGLGVQEYCAAHGGGQANSPDNVNWDCDSTAVNMTNLCRWQFYNTSTAIEPPANTGTDPRSYHWSCSNPVIAGALDLNHFCDNHYGDNGTDGQWGLAQAHATDASQPNSWQCQKP